MGSLKYEIAQKCKELQANKPVGGKHTSDKSWRAYLDAAVKYGEWCKQRYHCRHFSDCRPYVQDYADWLAFASRSITWLNRLTSSSFMERFVLCTISFPLSSLNQGPDRPGRILIMYQFFEKSQ